MGNLEREFVFEKDIIVKYTITRYKVQNSKDITPLKLQKSLYLAFAYYAGWVKSMKNMQSTTEDTDDFLVNRKPFLFESSFQAWDYGPVDKEVYSNFKYNVAVYDCDYDEVKAELEKTDPVAFSLVDNILNQTFELNDFALVEITHQDKAWIDNRGDVMDIEEIANEYSSRIN